MFKIKRGNNYYYCIYSAGKHKYYHRVLWEEKYGQIPKGKVIDHINGNGLDNRLENLRLVSNSFNNSNAKLRKDKKNGVHKNIDKLPGGSYRVMLQNKEHGIKISKSFKTLKEALEYRLELYLKYNLPTERLDNIL